MIEVAFEDLPVVTDPIAAMQPGALLMHPERGESNVCVHYKIRKGDVEAGFAQADVIVESEYHLPFQEHAYLQPEAGLAYIDEEGRVTVQCGGQWPHTDRAQIAHALGLPDDRVRVIYPAIGGAFGGREDMPVQVAEMQMNKLAEALGLDPVEFRMHNVLREGDTLGVGTAPPGPISIDRVIETAAETAGWSRTEKGWHRPGRVSPGKPYLKHGMGFAAGFKNVGFSFGYQENCWSRVELHGDGEIEQVVVHHAGAEVGQGAHTAMAQMVAEAAGVPLEKVTLHTSDTATMGNSGSASASRMTFMAGNAIRGAVEAALDKWRAEERPAIGEFKYLAPPTTPFTKETGQSMPNFAYAYAAQAAEVEVDTETGLVRLARVVAADDVGQAINPQMVKGQIEGAVAQAQGYALLENFQMQGGWTRFR